MDYYDGYNYDDDRGGAGGAGGGSATSSSHSGIVVIGVGGNSSSSSSGNRVLLPPSLLSGLHKEYGNGPGVVERFPCTQPGGPITRYLPHLCSSFCPSSYAPPSFPLSPNHTISFPPCIPLLLSPPSLPAHSLTSSMSLHSPLS